MIFFKLSWVPYILIIAGIALAAEGQFAALILTAVGVIWLVMKHQDKSDNSNSTTKPQSTRTAASRSSTVNRSATSTVTSANRTTTSATASTNRTTTSVPVSATRPVSTASTSSTAVKVEKVETVEEKVPAETKHGKFCRHCGAKVEENDIYCVECGEKI